MPRLKLLPACLSTSLLRHRAASAGWRSRVGCLAGLTLALVGCGLEAGMHDGGFAVVEEGRIGFAENDLQLMPGARFAADAGGRVYIGPISLIGAVAVVGTEGSLGIIRLHPDDVAQVSALAVAPTGDIYIADDRRMRVTVVSPAGRIKFAFDYPLPGTVADLRFGTSGALLTQVLFGLDPENPNPIMLLDESGRIVSHVAVTAGRWVFDTSEGGDLWAVARDTPASRAAVLQHYVDGFLIDSIALPITDAFDGLRMKDPRAIVRDILHDKGNGILWVLASASDLQGRRAEASAVFGLNDKEVVVQAALLPDTRVTQLLPGGGLVVTEEDSVGHFAARILRMIRVSDSARYLTNIKQREIKP